jgi:hypothetical protein
LETIQGRKLFVEIRYLYLPSPFSKSQRVIAKKAEYESIQELFFKVNIEFKMRKYQIQKLNGFAIEKMTGSRLLLSKAL